MPRKTKPVTASETKFEPVIVTKAQELPVTPIPEIPGLSQETIEQQQRAKEGMNVLIGVITKSVADSILSVYNAVTVLLLYQRLGMNQVAARLFLDELNNEVNRTISGELNKDDLMRTVKEQLDLDIVIGPKPMGPSNEPS